MSPRRHPVSIDYNAPEADTTWGRLGFVPELKHVDMDGMPAGGASARTRSQTLGAHGGGMLNTQGGYGAAPAAAPPTLSVFSPRARWHPKKAEQEQIASRIRATRNTVQQLHNSRVTATTRVMGHSTREPFAQDPMFR